MVCIFFVQFHPKERTDTVLAARTRAELDDHLDLLLENSHHLGMHWFEAERFELDWGVFGRPKTDALSSALFYVQDFLDVSPAADGRVWVAHHPKVLDNNSYNGKFEVVSDPESITSSEVDVFEVYVIGTQHTKSALKT
jgi:hypothetical protein